MSQDKFTPDQYFDLLRLFSEAKALMPLGSKKRAAWVTRAAAIKPPIPTDCPVCKHAACFLFNPFDRDSGYCAFEEQAHSDLMQRGLVL